MQDIQERLVQLEVHERLNKKNSIEYFVKGFENIVREYEKSQKLNPKGAKELARRHLQELESLFNENRAKIQDILSEAENNGAKKMQILANMKKIKVNFQDAQIFLSEGEENEKNILGLIDKKQREVKIGAICSYFFQRNTK